MGIGRRVTVPGDVLAEWGLNPKGNISRIGFDVVGDVTEDKVRAIAIVLEEARAAYEAGVPSNPPHTGMKKRSLVD